MELIDNCAVLLSLLLIAYHSTKCVVEHSVTARSWRTAVLCPYFTNVKLHNAQSQIAFAAKNQDLDFSVVSGRFPVDSKLHHLIVCDRRLGKVK